MRNPRGRLSEGWIVCGLDRSMGEPSEGQAVREVGRAKAGSSEDGPPNG